MSNKGTIYAFTGLIASLVTGVGCSDSSLERELAKAKAEAAAAKAEVVKLRTASDPDAPRSVDAQAAIFGKWIREGTIFREGLDFHADGTLDNLGVEGLWGAQDATWKILSSRGNGLMLHVDLKAEALLGPPTAKHYKYEITFINDHQLNFRQRDDDGPYVSETKKFVRSTDEEWTKHFEKGK